MFHKLPNCAPDARILGTRKVLAPFRCLTGQGSKKDSLMTPTECDIFMTVSSGEPFASEIGTVGLEPDDSRKKELPWWPIPTFQFPAT